MKIRNITISLLCMLMACTRSHAANPVVGFAEEANPRYRPTMEDAHTVAVMPEYAFFGVYDGHGGRKVADAVAHMLPKKIDTLLHAQKGGIVPVQETGRLLAMAFESTDAALDASYAGQQGCAAITALVTKNGDVHVAWVGDSRAVLAREGKALELSHDHKPSRADERKRVEDAGGFIAFWGVERVNGVLAMTRAFGDKELRPAIIAVPELTHEKITPDDEFLIIACDGLWDVCTNQEAVDAVYAVLKINNDYQEAANLLVKQALARGSTDNITVLVISIQDVLAGLKA